MVSLLNVTVSLNLYVISRPSTMTDSQTPNFLVVRRIIIEVSYNWLSLVLAQLCLYLCIEHDAAFGMPEYVSVMYVSSCGLILPSRSMGENKSTAGRDR